jgi:serine/threonine protein kinase
MTDMSGEFKEIRYVFIMILPGPGAAPQIHPLDPSDPQELGGYELLGRIGAGGMGVVYLAETRTGRKLALKAILKEYVQDPEFRTRFRAEVATAMKVRGRFLATVIDADPEGAQPWLAVEYVAGPSLTAVVRAQGPLPEPDVRRVVAGVAEALRSVHQAGIVHRDLKPSNILLGDEGPFVIDFGIAKALDTTSLTRTGLKVGTPSFMAPEQVRGSISTPAADVWALGAVALYAATGQRAFGEGDTTVVYYRVVHEEPDLSTCPAWLLPLVQACLAKDPEARPSLQEVLDFLNDVPDSLRAASSMVAPGPGIPDAVIDDDDVTALRDDETVLKVEPQAPTTPEPEPEAPRRSPLSRPLTWIVAAAGVLIVGGVATALLVGMPSGQADADADAGPSASASATPSASASPAAVIDECLVGTWQLESWTSTQDISSLDETVKFTGFEGRVTEFSADGTQVVDYDDAEHIRAGSSVGEITQTWRGTASYIVSTSDDGVLTTEGSDFRDISVTIEVGEESGPYNPNGRTQPLEYTCDETTYTERADGFEATYTKLR